MTTITCAADVVKALPKADIDSEGLWLSAGGVYLNCDANRLVMDGDFTPEQVQAVAYWATHRSEFPAPAGDGSDEPSATSQA